MAKKRTSRKSWTPKECLTLSQLVAEGIQKVSEIQQHFPNRSARAIRTRLRQTKQLSDMIDYRTSRKWTQGEDEKLMEFILQGKKAKEIENEFPGRTLSSIHTQFYAYNRNPDSLTVRSALRVRHDWTAEEDERLSLAMKEDMAPLDIQQLFPSRTFLAIKGRMYELRYFKAPDTIQQKERYEEGRTQDHALGVAADDKVLIDKQMGDRSEASALHLRRTRPWTLEEDNLLTDLVTEHQMDLMPLWDKMDNAYATGRHDDMPLIRTGAAARTRLSQLQDHSKYRTGSLDAGEIERLKQAIQEQVGDKFQAMVDIRQGDYAIPAEAETKTNTTEQDTRPGLKLGGPELARLDWDKIAQQVGKRHGRQCRTFLYATLHN
ncbi:hypothetical protein BG011_001415, partial [Mortierella polycephala]